eukprot:PhM_4_TR17408/c4_g1_i1/m.82224
MDILSSLLLEAALRVAVNPLDRVKILSQCTATTPTVRELTKDGTRGVWATLGAIRRSEGNGSKGLFRGSGLYVARTLLAPTINAVFMGLAWTVSNRTLVPRSVAIYGGGFLALAVYRPVDTVRTLMAVTSADEGPCRSVASTASWVYRTHGVAGFYRGFTLDLVGFAVQRFAHLTLMPFVEGDSIAEEVLRQLVINELIMAISHAGDTLRRRAMVSLLTQDGEPDVERAPSEGVVRTAMRGWWAHLVLRWGSMFLGELASIFLTGAPDEIEMPPSDD